MASSVNPKIKSLLYVYTCDKNKQLKYNSATFLDIIKKHEKAVRDIASKIRFMAQQKVWPDRKTVTELGTFFNLNQARDIIIEVYYNIFSRFRLKNIFSYNVQNGEGRRDLKD